MSAFPSLFLLSASFCRRHILAFLAIALGLPAYAGPPFHTGDPDTADKGTWEASLGVVAERRPGEKVYELPGFEVNYGLADGLEFSYESAWLQKCENGVPSESGYGNSLVGLKWRFLEQEKHGVTVALKPEFEFRNPGSSSVQKGLADDENTFLLDLRVQRAFGENLLGLSFARTFPSKSDGSWEYGMFLKRETAKGHTFGVELTGSSTKAFNRSALVLNFGAQIKLTAQGKLLLGLGRELHNHDEPAATFIGYLGWQQLY